MLIEFRFKNYRSFRDESILSMEATGLGYLKNVLIPLTSKMKLLPACAIYGKNGGGKSNVVRALWLAVQFICNAQRTQHEKASIPVRPFLLNDYSKNEPTTFDFEYTFKGQRFWYGFAATREKIISEYLYHSPKGQKALVFLREGRYFSFTEDKTRRKLIGEMVADNQLYFSIACTMNDASCMEAMQWFRNQIYFSRDFAEMPAQLLEYYEDPFMLEAISKYAKAADLGIQDMQFEMNNQEINGNNSLPTDMPDELKKGLTGFMQALTESSTNGEILLKLQEVVAKTKHTGVNKNGERALYQLELADESDGTRKLMSLAPAVESALTTGGVLVIDEIERELHPVLVQYIISKFQSKTTNPLGAQIIFTTHNTELMNMEILRKDQIYFADKENADGVSELYSISFFSTRTSDNIRKAYFAGKFGAIPNVELEEVT